MLFYVCVYYSLCIYCFKAMNHHGNIATTAAITILVHDEWMIVRINQQQATLY